MPTVREIIKRDIGVKIEGVVKVFDRAALATEIREYVVTDKIEAELKRIFDTFTHVSDTLRRSGTPRDVMGMWVSGFFGSGKSHFAKVLGYLLQNDHIEDCSAESCIDVFTKHLSDSPRGKDIHLRLGEVKQTTTIKTIAFEIKSRQSLNNPNSVGEILIGEFYRSIGLADNFIVARIERRLQQQGMYDQLEKMYEFKFGVPWKSPYGREDLMTVRRRLAEVLPEINPVEYPDIRTAKNALGDMFRHEQLTAEGIADELVAWIDSQKQVGGKVYHLIFVIDEMGTFIGDSNEKISEFNALAEMIGNKGKGKIWIIATSQQDLERVVDRTNFEPALIGRLNARFELKPHLISDEINKVVSERILKKHPSQESAIKTMYQSNEGRLAQLADIKSSRNLGIIEERSFIDCYPFLPHQIRLAQDIFEALSGVRISGGVRSMIAVVMEALQDLSDDEIGVLVSFDQVFDAVENDLLSQEYLGASGVRSIRESDERVSNTHIEPARVLKILWLLQKITWVPRVPETLAKLLVRHIDEDFVPLRDKVELTLEALQEAGYVARDEATGEWKFLNERERSIEQAIQEMVRPGGPKSITIGSVRRVSQEICKSDLVTRKKLSNFAVTFGTTKILFSFGVYVDGEAVDTGPELEVHFVSPLATGRKQTIEEIREQNLAAGIRGRTVWWGAVIPVTVENRFKRYEALVKVTGDKRFVDDPSRDTQDALSEKRKERDELRVALVKDLEKTFLDGTVFYGGQEVPLDNETDLKGPVTKCLTSLIPHVYPRLSLADREYDFSKDLKALLNPAMVDLHKVAENLDLFDTQGNLQHQSPLVERVLEVVGDLEDEDLEPKGALLLDAKDNKGFKGFSRTPFGWPDELTRLILAACFRAGAIYLEQQTSAGSHPLYDYKNTGDTFSKITEFKKTTFRIAATSLSVDELKEASKALIAMGATGTPESGNAIAGAIRELGRVLKAGSRDAIARKEQGLPIPDAIVVAEDSLQEPTTAKDPTTAVKAFLAEKDKWIALHGTLNILRNFLDANRHHEYDLSRKLAELAVNHPVPDDHPLSSKIAQALADMEALIESKEIIDRWVDYRSAFEQALDAYRKVYLDVYGKVRSEVEEVLAQIKASKAYDQATSPQRDEVIDDVFGPGKACHCPEISLPTASSLLEAAAKRSIGALELVLVALPSYYSQVLDALNSLAEPVLGTEKTLVWRASEKLAGKRLSTPDQVDEVFAEVAQELKELIREGNTVVLK